MIRKETELPIAKVKPLRIIKYAQLLAYSGATYGPVMVEALDSAVPVPVTAVSPVATVPPVAAVPVAAAPVPVPDKHFLANKNPHPRDANAMTIALPKVGEKYGIAPNRRGFISPSKFIHHFAEPFDADAIIAKIIASGNPKYADMTPDEIKIKWEKESKQACADGTKMHNAIELYYNQVPGVKKASAWEGLDDECKQFDEFIAFQEATGLVPIRTEWYIYDEDTRIAGYIDMLFRNSRGGYEIYDWKRVREIKTGFAIETQCIVSFGRL